MSNPILVGTKDILIISTSDDTPIIEVLLGDSSEFGISLSYCARLGPYGLAETFICNDACAMVLGNNIFYGNGSRIMLNEVIVDVEERNFAIVFGYYVQIMNNLVWLSLMKMEGH